MIQKTLFGEPCIVVNKTTKTSSVVENYTGYLALVEIQTITHITKNIGNYNPKGWSACSSDYVYWKFNDLTDFTIKNYKNLSVVILDEIEGFEYMRFDPFLFKTVLEVSESLPHGDMSDPEQVKTYMEFFLARRIKLYKCLEKEKIVLYPAYPGMLEVLQNKLDIKEIFKLLDE